MTQGKLEVLLVSAKGLDGADFLSNVDPYAVLTCRTQEHKSSVASGNGSNPEWNENFIFTISSSASQLNVKLFDKDTFTADDFLGEAEIPLEPAFSEGSLPVTAYNIVKDGEYCGEVKLSLTFRAEERYDRDLPDETFGGWKDSDVAYA